MSRLSCAAASGPAALRPEDAPRELVIHQLQHPRDVVLVDVRDVEQVQLLAVRPQGAERRGDVLSVRVAHAAVHEDVGAVGAQQQAVALPCMEDR